MAHELSLASAVPVALHLDHGDSFATVAKCLRAGYASIVIDGSKLGFDENIALSRRVAEMCEPNSVPVVDLGSLLFREGPTILRAMQPRGIIRLRSGLTHIVAH